MLCFAHRLAAVLARFDEVLHSGHMIAGEGELNGHVLRVSEGILVWWLLCSGGSRGSSKALLLISFQRPFLCYWMIGP